MQLAGGDPLSPDVMAGHAAGAFPFGSGNAEMHVCHRMTSRHSAPPASDEFVGMADYASESVFDLLVEGLTLGYSSDSSNRSHHPSRKFFMAGTPEGHVEDVVESRDPLHDRTPPGTPVSCQGGNEPQQRT